MAVERTYYTIDPEGKLTCMKCKVCLLYTSGISKKSGSHLPNLSGTEYNSFVDMFCHHFIAAFLSART